MGELVLTTWYAAFEKSARDSASTVDEFLFDITISLKVCLVRRNPCSGPSSGKPQYDKFNFNY